MSRVSNNYWWLTKDSIHLEELRRRAKKKKKRLSHRRDKQRIYKQSRLRKI